MLRFFPSRFGTKISSLGRPQILQGHLLLLRAGWALQVCVTSARAMLHKGPIGPDKRDEDSSAQSQWPLPPPSFIHSEVPDVFCLERLDCHVQR